MSMHTYAQDIEFSRQDIQNELNARMPYTHNQGFFAITFVKPAIHLNAKEQRVKIKTDLTLSTALGSENKGYLDVDGKIRYNSSNYSFYIDEPKVNQLHLDGLNPSLQPQVIALAQEFLSPLLTGQPVYQLSNDKVEEALAKMMLKSIEIKNEAVVAKLSLMP